MKGGSQSSLIGASDSKFYVLKLKNNPQGPNTLFNEAFGSILAEYLGLPVPQWRPIRVDSKFIWENPDLCFALEERVQVPCPDLHFGSNFLIGSLDDEVYEIVPDRWMERIENPHFFAGMLLLDIWAENLARRQVLFVESAASRTLKVLFFDHGHMFGGPHGDKKLKSPKARLYYHRNVYKAAFESGNMQNYLLRIERLTETMLQAMIERVPCEWRSPSLQSDTIGLLMRNQRSLRQKATKIIEEFLN